MAGIVILTAGRQDIGTTTKTATGVTLYANGQCTMLNGTLEEGRYGGRPDGSVHHFYGKYEPVMEDGETWYVLNLTERTSGSHAQADSLSVRRDARLDSCLVKIKLHQTISEVQLTDGSGLGRESLEFDRLYINTPIEF